MSKGKLSVLKIGSLNCEGLNDYYKRMAVFHSLKESDLSIIFLQETKLQPELEYKYIKEWHNGNCIFNSTIGSKSGTAILVNTPAVKFLCGSKMVDIEGRVIAVDIEVYGSRVHLVNSYGPNDGRLRVAFLNRIYLYLNSGNPILWAGDHNVTTNPRLDRYPARFDGDVGRGEFLDIMASFDLKDVCRSLYPNLPYFTFRRGTSKSRIDKICVSSNFSIRNYSHEDTGFSDHMLISSSIVFQSIYERGPGIWKNNVRYYADETFLEDFRVFWNDCVSANDNYSRNIVNWWMDFKYKFKLFYIKYSRQKLMFQRRHDQILEDGLYNATQALNQNPDNRVLVNNYIRMKKELVDSKIKSAKERIFKRDAQYLMQGEKPVKAFFDKFKNKRENQQILSLINDDGVEVFDMKSILRVAESYYKKLFSPREVRQVVINLFLNNLTPESANDSFMSRLMEPFSLQEIWDAIVSFFNGRSPGPDGMSIEFYKVVFDIIKNDLRRVLNSFLGGARMPAKFKAGLITLVPKQEPVNDIGNFRPISLLNSDYKIFTKIITTRLKPILENIIHGSQFAQPGKDIQGMNTVIRDLVTDMERSSTDSFFVSVDFRKAYDSVNHNFLFQVLGQYGFPRDFINIIRELFRDAGSHVFINGHKSAKIKLRSGIRQGCPMSRSTFTLQLNPLLVFLNSFSGITKYKSLSNKEFLTMAFMDDANFFTQSLSSLINSLFYIRKFKHASGLEINMGKSVGKFYNKQNFHQVSHLPDIKWEEKLSVVKIMHSPRSCVISQWNDVLSMFKKEVKYFKSFTNTFQAKAIISKSKLLSKLNYICSVHVMPKSFRVSLDKVLFNFLIPFSSKSMSEHEVDDRLHGFAAPKHLGGYGVDHITLHADLFLLKPVMKYVKCRVENLPLPNELFFVEYHIGVQLSRLFGFKVNNCTTHTDQPSEVYHHVLDLIRWMLEKNMITIEDLLLGSVSGIYKRIIFKLNERNVKLKYYRILSDMLPSYLQSFNYKLHNNLLPVSTLFREYALDNNSCCLFCGVGPESIFHIFGTCEKLGPIWKVASETILAVTHKQFDFADIRKNLMLDLVCVNVGSDRKFEKLLIYLNTVINHSIWKERNDIKFNFKRFDICNVVKRIIRTTRARRNVDHKLIETKRVPYLGDYCHNFLIVCRKYFPFDNG